MEKLRILIAGCGDVGLALAGKLANSHTVFALRRSLKTYTNGILGIQADLSNTQTLQNLPSIDIVVYCAAPSAAERSLSILERYQKTYVQGFHNLMSALPAPPKRAFFTSSTSVYGQDSHQWIDETSLTEPLTQRGKLMLHAEQQVKQYRFPTTIVRFSGIYADNRIHFLNQVLQGTAPSESPKVYSNRIHRDDCAAVLNHLIAMIASSDKQYRQSTKPIADLYLASDNNPAPIAEVAHWLAKQTNTPITNISNTRSTASKRCSNKLLCDTGFEFQYPNYQVGYQEILDQLGLNLPN